MELLDILQNVELFEGLDTAEIEQISRLCTERNLEKGGLLTTQDETGDELFIITEGLLEVVVGGASGSQRRVVVNLGEGQIVGEMALIDLGPRSATVRAVTEPTTVQVIRREDFDRLCQENNHIGYIVMRNLAADLSFKLRHRNLSERG